MTQQSSASAPRAVSERCDAGASDRAHQRAKEPIDWMPAKRSIKGEREQRTGPEKPLLGSPGVDNFD
jgi:hypothetical protein